MIWRWKLHFQDFRQNKLSPAHSSAFFMYTLFLVRSKSYFRNLGFTVKIWSNLAPVWLCQVWTQSRFTLRIMEIRFIIFETTLVFQDETIFSLRVFSWAKVYSGRFRKLIWKHLKPLIATTSTFQKTICCARTLYRNAFSYKEGGAQRSHTMREVADERSYSLTALCWYDGASWPHRMP